MLGNWENKFYEDEYNVNGKRTLKNVSRDQFNCMGYATNMLNWGLPCDTEAEAEELFDVDVWLEDVEDVDFDERANICADWMLRNIPNLRKVDSPDEKLADDEWLIGFKMGMGSSFDGDFHFIKRTPSGRYYHKPGTGRIRRMSKAEALGDTWSNGAYESTTIWFARRK